MGHSWRLLDRSWRLLERSSWNFGKWCSRFDGSTVFEGQGPLLEPLGVLLAALGALLELSWRLLGPCGGSWNAPGAP